MKEKIQQEIMERAKVPIELVAQGATIVKLENAEQMAIAVQRPRDEAIILRDCLHELDLYPTMAREAIYNKPVGRDDSGQMKYAEGLSIRAAESLGNRWNNSSYGVEIIAEDEETATIAAVFLDYEKNTRHVAMQRVSKFYKNKGGQIVRHAPDRFDLVLKANSSKNLREIVLRSLPAGLKKEYETKARNILKKEPLAQQRTIILERFAELSITIEQLEAWKSKSFKEWKKEDIIDALGVINALRDGEMNIEGIFAKIPEVKKECEPGLKIKEKSKTEELSSEKKSITCPKNQMDIDESECEQCAQITSCSAMGKGEEMPKESIGKGPEIKSNGNFNICRKIGKDPDYKVSLAFCRTTCRWRKTCPVVGGMK